MKTHEDRSMDALADCATNTHADSPVRKEPR